MATISMSVNRQLGSGQVGVFFTAPFDCIIGLDFYEPCSNITRDRQIGLAGTQYQLIAYNILKGTKISSIIMKSGESLMTSSGYISVYITGVSA